MDDGTRSDAQVITVFLVDDHEVVRDVTDTGIGIPDTVARSGLHNLAQRATDAGGQCTVERVAGGGTRLLWSAPLP